MTKKRLLVVGSFGSSKGDGRQGGLSFACTSLFESDLGESFQIVRIDSTISSIRNRSGLARLPSAILRIVTAVWHMVFGRVSYVVCFTSHGNSFLEKGVMTLCGRVLGKHVILMPRSGHLILQFERSYLFRCFARCVLKASWRVGCQSLYWQEYYSKFLRGDAEVTNKLFIIENWLPDEAFIDSNSCISSSSCKERAFLVGFYNRIEIDKGIYNFIDSVVAANMIDSRIRGVIYGDGAELSAMQTLIESRNLGEIVEYRGWLSPEEKRTALRKLDTIAFTSYAEGFPNSLLETVALKIPSIATSVGAVNDLLQDGVSGLLVEPNDVDALTVGILRFAQNETLRQNAAEAAYRKVYDNNRLEKAIATVRDILA